MAEIPCFLVIKIKKQEVSRNTAARDLDSQRWGTTII
jgi:hypothetical protein